MEDQKIRLFMELAGQEYASQFETADIEKRKLGAQLLLSEVLEYVIKGLGVTPVVGTTEISDANNLEYKDSKAEPSKLEMVDGLADVAYTMYWNSVAFGVPLKEAFNLVCDNNLEKFVKLENWSEGQGQLSEEKWHLNCNTSWPPEVESVEVIKVQNNFYGVGKDKTGKVRKPSHYKSVNLEHFCD